jgi:hypothetical protein
LSSLREKRIERKRKKQPPSSIDILIKEQKVLSLFICIPSTSTAQFQLSMKWYRVKLIIRKIHHYVAHFLVCKVEHTTECY